ncbi:LysR family transcriptional regulator [Geobacillus sp. FSL W8-0032]|uniref:HTH-type transcriptional regulator GltC n=1 Tax=Geobacillus icigianus TaxID=1430331 RepID=A0ABU6BGK6_9BACL|nr:LysR family transcriptional regulator [Geobacillus icigianus]MEB3750947.1 HTH-type transcriptional regulator GltC [Geobacillus icigianus]
MDLRTIKTFQTVVKHKSFQRAAEELNYAQSTVTTHIKNLEAELGITLIKRGKPFQLTEAGKLLSEKGEFLLKSFDHLQKTLKECIDGERGLVRIGVMEPTASHRLPAWLSAFRDKQPNILFTIQIHSNQMLVDMVERGDIDAAICATPETMAGASFEPLFSEEVVLLSPASHPLAKRSVVYLRDLADEPLLVTSAACPFRRNLEKRLVELGIQPLYKTEISNMLALKYYVHASLGIAVVPKIAVTPPPAGTVAQPIADFRDGLTVGILRMFTSEASHPATEKWIRFLLDQCAGRCSTDLHIF